MWCSIVKEVKVEERAERYEFGGEGEEGEVFGSIDSLLPEEQYSSGNMNLGRTQVPISNPRFLASSARVVSAIGKI
jgi:hypothetical protein